jgi:hypothetical protein
MSSTVRHLVMDPKPLSPNVSPHAFHISSVTPIELAEQKSAFDLRRSLKLADDNQRLHLDEIQKTLPHEGKSKDSALHTSHPKQSS